MTLAIELTIRGGISLDLHLMTRVPPARFRQKEPFHSCVVVVSDDRGLRVLNRVRLWNKRCSDSEAYFMVDRVR